MDRRRALKTLAAAATLPTIGHPPALRHRSSDQRSFATEPQWPATCLPEIADPPAIGMMVGELARCVVGSSFFHGLDCDLTLAERPPESLLLMVNEDARLDIYELQWWHPQRKAELNAVRKLRSAVEQVIQEYSPLRLTFTMPLLRLSLMSCDWPDARYQHRLVFAQVRFVV
jgi:hypothetical protein